MLQGEGGGDGGGFKGVFARYAGDYLRHDPTRAYEGWLAQNADAAWSHRNARDLMGQDWAGARAGGRAARVRRLLSRRAAAGAARALSRAYAFFLRGFFSLGGSDAA